jgi:hypothetical protein
MQLFLNCIKKVTILFYFLVNVMQKVNHLILQLPFCCYYSCIRAWAYKSTKYFPNSNFLVAFLMMIDSIYYKHFFGFYCFDLATFVKLSCSAWKPTPLTTTYLCFILFKHLPCSIFSSTFVCCLLLRPIIFIKYNFQAQNVHWP